MVIHHHPCAPREDRGLRLECCSVGSLGIHATGGQVVDDVRFCGYTKHRSLVRTSLVHTTKTQKKEEFNHHRNTPKDMFIVDSLTHTHTNKERKK